MLTDEVPATIAGNPVRHEECIVKDSTHRYATITYYNARLQRSLILYNDSEAEKLGRGDGADSGKVGEGKGCVINITVYSCRK